VAVPERVIEDRPSKEDIRQMALQVAMNPSAEAMQKLAEMQQRIYKAAGQTPPPPPAAFVPPQQVQIKPPTNTRAELRRRSFEDARANAKGDVADNHDEDPNDMSDEEYARLVREITARQRGETPMPSAEFPSTAPPSPSAPKPELPMNTGDIGEVVHDPSLEGASAGVSAAQKSEIEQATGGFVPVNHHGG
jgi:hypothetical protein